MLPKPCNKRLALVLQEGFQLVLYGLPVLVRLEHHGDVLHQHLDVAMHADEALDLLGDSAKKLNLALLGENTVARESLHSKVVESAPTVLE